MNNALRGNKFRAWITCDFILAAFPVRLTGHRYELLSKEIIPWDENCAGIKNFDMLTSFLENETIIGNVEEGFFDCYGENESQEGAVALILIFLSKKVLRILLLSKNWSENELGNT